MDTLTRQEKLCSSYDFMCDCDFCCSDDFDPNILKKAVEKARFTRYISKNEEDIIQQIKENWKIINADPSSSDSLLLIYNHILLQQILTFSSSVEPTLSSA